MPGGFVFHYGPKLVCEAGAARKLTGLLPKRRVLFVTDRRILDLGLAEPTLTALRAGGIEAVVYDDVEPDPSLQTVMAAQQAGRQARAEVVIGFGGGSPMDVAKIVAYLLGTGEDIHNLWGLDKAHGEKLPLVLVPTTAGTGSEATPVTVITVGGTEKKGISSAALIADCAILDPELTVGLPREVTAATGVDAVVHAVEAYTSALRKNPLSDMLARRALELLDANLLRACDRPEDLQTRSNMLLGAHLAGVAFANAPVGGVHALAYPLGTHFHIPHGVSNALMLPHVLHHNLPAAIDPYEELGRFLEPNAKGLSSEAYAERFIDRLRRLSKDVGLPDRLSNLGIGAEHLDLLAGEAMKQERLLVNNPRAINEADARRLYEAAL